MKRTILLALLLAAPAMAQQSQDPAVPRAPLPEDRGYDKPQARTDAINAPNRPELDATNRAVNQAAQARDAANVGVTASAQAAYDYDMANYLATLRAHDATAANNEAKYAAKQRAYADAMRAWRVQVWDCNRGIIAACRAPTPDPAAFY
ncbi:MAG TPA: hypothetical protein VL405_04935 [Sphingomonas sp.]|jgi:hypothetical protein|nr:hypothetical protein [Sphingomonas sp.]